MIIFTACVHCFCTGITHMLRDDSGRRTREMCFERSYLRTCINRELEMDLFGGEKSDDSPIVGKVNEFEHIKLEFNTRFLVNQRHRHFLKRTIAVTILDCILSWMTDLDMSGMSQPRALVTPSTDEAAISAATMASGGNDETILSPRDNLDHRSM